MFQEPRQSRVVSLHLYLSDALDIIKDIVFGQDLNKLFGVCPPLYSDADSHSVGFLLLVAYDSGTFQVFNLSRV